MTLPNCFKKQEAPLIDLAFLINEPPDVYHAQRDKYLSSHMLADFRRIPLLYRRKQLGLIKDEDRPAFLIGRAAHTLILEGKTRYEASYAVGGPINPKTGEKFGSRTKAFEEWADAQGKPVLTDDQALLIENLHTSVRTHDHAAILLTEGVAEGVTRKDYCGVACQGRFDWISPYHGLVDLKTCDSMDYLQADAKNYGYIYQLAFYRSLLPVQVPVYLIAVEKKEPFRCGVWRIGEDVLGIAQQDNESAIERLKVCQKTDTWETGYEDIRTFDLI